MTTAEHPTPAQAQLLAEVDNLHVTPEELAKVLRAVAGALPEFSPLEANPPQPSGTLAVSAISDLVHSAVLNSITVNYQESARALGAAMATNRSALSPQQARSLQAAENIWRRIDQEYGLLNSVQVAALLSRKPSRTPAASLRSEGKIIGIMRGNSYRFPGFQFDKEQGTVLPVMAQLIALARENGRSDEDLVFWLTSASSYFHEEDRPVDHLHEEDRVLAAARDQFESTW